MEFKTYSSPHLPVSDSVAVMMQRVLVALLPGIACAFWVFGWGILINIVLATGAALAAEAGVTVACECHANTLTETAASTRALLAVVDHPNLCMLWQPPNNVTREVRSASLEAEAGTPGTSPNPEAMGWAGFVAIGLWVSFLVPRIVTTAKRRWAA